MENILPNDWDKEDLTRLQNSYFFIKEGCVERSTALAKEQVCHFKDGTWKYSNYLHLPNDTNKSIPIEKTFSSLAELYRYLNE